MFKIKLVKAFDGTRSKLHELLNEVWLVLQWQPHAYPNEEWCFSKWDIIPEKDAPMMHNFKAFIEELESSFEEIDMQLVEVCKISDTYSKSWV